MTLAQSISYIRRELVVAKHLAYCMADPGVRAAGLRRVWAAVRIARRLRLDHVVTGVSL